MARRRDSVYDDEPVADEPSSGGFDFTPNTPPPGAPPPPGQDAAAGLEDPLWNNLLGQWMHPSGAPYDELTTISTSAPGRGGFTPREAQDVRLREVGSGSAPSQAAPSQPSTPTPSNAAVSQAPSAPSAPMAGVRPFAPLSSLATPGSSGRLFGRLGGLQGGGLGTALRPTTGFESESIDSLIEELLRGQ